MFVLPKDPLKGRDRYLPAWERSSEVEDEAFEVETTNCPDCVVLYGAVIYCKSCEPEPWLIIPSEEASSDD